MKIKTAAIAAAALFGVCAFAGCKKTTYSVYTNMPQSSYTLSDKSYKLAAEIGGYCAEQKQFEDKDTSAYTSLGRYFFSMMADAQLVASDDFTKDGAQENYANFNKAVSDVLNGVDKALSTSVDNSDVSRFNAAPAGKTIEICEITYNVLSEAKYVYNLTDGCYNPALYYNIQAYGFGGAEDFPHSESELPSAETVAQYTDLASHLGEVDLSEAEGKFYVKKPDYTVTVGEETLSMKLDLGGIGKGYAVDKIDGLFDEYGYEFGYFNFGSSSILFKSNVKAGSWNLGLSGPRSINRDAYLQTKVRGEKLSTSGDDEQYYKIGKTRYCHVIDPATGKPVQTGIMSVTVIGGGAAQADALTTAIMCMGKDRAIEFIEGKLTDRKVTFTCE